MNDFMETIFLSVLISAISGYLAYYFALLKFKEKLIFKEIYLRRLTHYEEVCKRAHQFRRAIVEWMREKNDDTGKKLQAAQDKFRQSFEDNAFYFEKNTVKKIKDLFYTILTAPIKGDLTNFYPLQEEIEDEARKFIKSTAL